MKLELHILQNFAPSNLNRDDTGAPKDCEFGGYRRGRISSQCLKRAIRDAFVVHDLVPASERAARTKRLVKAMAELLEKNSKRPLDEAMAVSTVLVQGAGLGVSPDAEAKTQYLLFVPQRLVQSLAGLAEENWNDLVKLVPAKKTEGASSEPAEGRPSQEPQKRGKKEKAEAKAALPKELAKAVQERLADAANTPELALFGRMIADAPDWNVDAACQVAHAISTNRVSMEFDFYTAVDDLRPGDTQGSDMMGTMQLNSCCFYRYAVLDTAKLEANLGAGSDARDAALRATEAFLRASVLAIPTGKQNSSAAHNPPSYVLAVLRRGAPVSLANAFALPARPDGSRDLVDASIEKLETYWAKINDMLGANAVDLSVSCADRDLASKGIDRVASIDELVKAVRSRLEGTGGAA